jgi:FkbM family methyltransferase
MNAPPDELFALLAPTRPTAVVDVGASDFGEVPPYRPLLDRGIATLVGFEPQPDLLAPLQARRNGAETYLPYALGDGQRHTLHVCAFAAMSSFLKPDARQLHQFIPMGEWGRVVQQIPMSTRRLDDVAEIAAMDFLKIDVQGFELTVFRHGRKRLGQAVAVQAELPFVTIYEQQPALGEIDLELRALGFIPHAIAGQFIRMIAPLVGPQDSWRGINQLHEADFIYVRDFARAEAMTDEQLKHMALLAHHCFRSYDLAYRALFVLVERRTLEPGVLARYLELMRAAARA